jgi:hypothetical protein
MKKLHGLLIVAALIFFSSCNPKISTSIRRSYPPLDYKQEIVVIGLAHPEPENAEVLGQVKIGDTGFSTKCGYDIVIDKAKLEARKAGGNAIKIIEHKPPTAMGSTCHRITAKILKAENIESYKPVEVVDSTLLHADYAILHIYRNSGVGALVSYDLHLGDTTICRVKNRWKKSIKVKKDGYNTLWARTEAKKELPMKIEFGREYYIRCAVTMGAFVGHPSLELVDNISGKAEFDAVKLREADKRDLLVLTDGREIECVIKNEDDHNVYFSIFRDGNKIDTQMSKDKIQSIERAE